MNSIWFTSSQCLMRSSPYMKKFEKAMKETWQVVWNNMHNLFDAADKVPEDRYIPPHQEQKTTTPIAKQRASFGFSWRFRFAGACMVMLWYYIFSSLDLLYLVLTGMIIAMASEKMIMHMQSRMPRWVAIMFTYLLFVLFVLAGALLVFPFLAQQIAEILSQLLARATWVQEQLQWSDLITVINQSDLHNSLKNILISIIWSGELWVKIQEWLLANISQIVSTSSWYIKNIGDVLVWLLWGLFSGIAQIVIIFTIAIFFSIEKTMVIWFFQQLWGHTSRIDHIINSLYHRLWSRLKWQLFLCLTLWVAVAIWLYILALFGLNIPNKLTLSLIAGLMEFIPYVWPILWWLPAILVATLTYGWIWFVVVFILYAVIQQVENNVLVPVVMNHAVWVSPLLVFLSMLVCGSLLGILWVLIAVPVAVMIDVARSHYQQQKLDDEIN